MKLRFVVLLFHTADSLIVIVWIRRGPLPSGGGPLSLVIRVNGWKNLWQRIFGIGFPSL
jgi:hypothetical protein